MENNRIFIWMDPTVCELRQEDIRAYCRWVEERLVPSFGNWDEEEKSAGDRYLDRMAQYFDPDSHDPSDFYEGAYDHAINHCLVLAEVNSYMMAMAISGLYHLWEKQVLKHLEKEVGRYVEEYKPPRNWDKVCEYFSAFSTDLCSLPFSPCLEELRLVTNVAKHGSGQSLEWLKAGESDILSEVHATNEMPITGGEFSMLRAPIYPRLEHFIRYKEAVLNFWNYDFWKKYGERRYYIE